MKEMKKYLFFLFFLITTTMSFAQSKFALPTFRVTLEREVDYAVIEKMYYFDVVVELKAAAADDLFIKGVKVTVKDARTGKKIFKKRFSNSYLYAFSDGTITVGKGNVLTQLILFKSEESRKWCMEIKQKGIY